MPITVDPNFMPVGTGGAPLSAPAIAVDPSMLSPAKYSAPGPTLAPPDYSQPPPADLDLPAGVTRDTPDDVVREWQWAPDNKSLVGKTANGDLVQASPAQVQADITAGRATGPENLMNLARPSTSGPGASEPAAELGKMVTGAMPPQPATSPGAGIDAKAQRDLNAGIDAQKRAIQQGAQVGAQRAAEQAVYQDQLSQHLDTMQAQQAQKAGAQQRFMDGQFRDLQTQMAVVNSAKVDPSHWYATRDTGQKVLAGLGIALGAMGSALTGGPNAALQIVQSAIERDIDAQKTNLASAREGVGQKMNLIGLYRQKFGDDAQADAAARATMLDNAKQKLMAMAAKYDAPEAKAKAAEVAAQLDQEKAKALSVFGQRAQERSFQEAELGLKGQELGLQDQQRRQALGERLVPNVGPNGETGVALDKDAAKTLREKVTTYRDVDNKLDRLIALRKDFGAETYNRTAVNQARALAAQLKIAINKNEGLNRLSEADLSILDQITGGDPARLGYVLPQLQELKTSVNQAFQETAKTYLDPSYSGGGGAIPSRPLK